MWVVLNHSSRGESGAFLGVFTEIVEAEKILKMLYRGDNYQLFNSDESVFIRHKSELYPYPLGGAYKISLNLNTWVTV